MAVAAGVLGLLFAAVHGLSAPQLVRAAPAAAGSGEAGAIPRGARLAWAALVVVTAVGAVVMLTGAEAGGLVVLATGTVGIAALAVANGRWMHGRPHWRHHVVRAGFAAVVLVPAALAVA